MSGAAGDYHRQYTSFFISNCIFGVNVKVALQIYVFKVKSCLAISKGIKQVYVKLTIFILLPVPALNIVVRN